MSGICIAHGEKMTMNTKLCGETQKGDHIEQPAEMERYLERESNANFFGSR